jgi:hypothetical protein
MGFEEDSLRRVQTSNMVHHCSQSVFLLPASHLGYQRSAFPPFHLPSTVHRPRHTTAATNIPLHLPSIPRPVTQPPIPSPVLSYPTLSYHPTQLISSLALDIPSRPSYPTPTYIHNLIPFPLLSLKPPITFLPRHLTMLSSYLNYSSHTRLVSCIAWLSA